MASIQNGRIILISDVVELHDSYFAFNENEFGETIKVEVGFVDIMMVAGEWGLGKFYIYKDYYNINK